MVVESPEGSADRPAGFLSLLDRLRIVREVVLVPSVEAMHPDAASLDQRTAAGAAVDGFTHAIPPEARSHTPRWRRGLRAHRDRPASAHNGCFRRGRRGALTDS